eukprot:scaffold134650_cov32-Tisochrysis_lutea.AAC.2
MVHGHCVRHLPIRLASVPATRPWRLPPTARSGSARGSGSPRRASTSRAPPPLTCERRSIAVDGWRAG